MIRPEDLLDQVPNRKSDEYEWIFLHVRGTRTQPFYHQLQAPRVYTVGLLLKETEPITESGAECLTWLDNLPPDSVVLTAALASPSN
ncbi:hypothetical protein PanWU01x14_350110 [Parasponia andersonii]|uniref:Uncharacterized protein n=1 Tax=Parasponia andersonii TaxID=3476 RepID=A0A2P5AB33_PARAD|nr:hypothetical protein PanWU01x14_350110 [Parasponia andersonii]